MGAEPGLAVLAFTLGGILQRGRRASAQVFDPVLLTVLPAIAARLLFDLLPGAGP